MPMRMSDRNPLDVSLWRLHAASAGSTSAEKCAAAPRDGAQYVSCAAKGVQDLKLDSMKVSALITKECEAEDFGTSVLR